MTKMWTKRDATLFFMDSFSVFRKFWTHKRQMITVSIFQIEVEDKYWRQKTGENIEILTFFSEQIFFQFNNSKANPTAIFNRYQLKNHLKSFFSQTNTRIGNVSSLNEPHSPSHSLIYAYARPVTKFQVKLRVGLVILFWKF